jgi:type IV pilus assembly protein PilB
MFWFFKRGGGAKSNELRGRPIGRVLTNMGKVTRPQVFEALTLQQREGGKLGEILVRLGHTTPEDVAAALAAQKGESASD